MLTLITRNGKNIGNAILVGAANDHQHEEPLFLIETDFGNRTKLNWAEIEEWFTIGRCIPYEVWNQERHILRKGPELDWVEFSTPT